MTFDNALDTVKSIILKKQSQLAGLDWLIIERDEKGKINLIIPSEYYQSQFRTDKRYVPEGTEEKIAIFHSIQEIAKEIDQAIFPYVKGFAIKHESSLEKFKESTGHQLRKLGQEAALKNIWVYDSTMEGSLKEWAKIFKNTHFDVEENRSYRIALLRKEEENEEIINKYKETSEPRKMMVIDLDLYNIDKAISNNRKLDSDKRPQYGVIDWLIEAQNGQGISANAKEVLENMVGEKDGEMFVLSQTTDKGSEGILRKLAMLGRIDYLKNNHLALLIHQLEEHYRPEIIFICYTNRMDAMALKILSELHIEKTELTSSMETLMTYAWFSEGNKLTLDEWGYYLPVKFDEKASNP